jgi:glycosyltransferase involved in cell wall biosynthesis
MKIAHVVDSMEVGGAETLVSQMCRLQRAQGHYPTIYAIASLGPLGEQLRREGFVVRANMARHLPDAFRLFYRIFKESRPDIVHLHNPTPTVYAAISARSSGVCRIVSTRHGLVEGPHAIVAELKYAVAAAFCDHIVGICETTVDNLRRLHTIPARKIVRIYNGVMPIERILPAMCPPKKGLTVLFVGRLAAVKNLSLLLKAFRTALSSRPDLRLWIVGDGPERSSLERLATESNIVREVTFWGQQLNVAPFFSAADIFLMSSISEGLPLSLLQAFSAGLPSIVTDVGGMAEAVRLSKAGIVVPPANSLTMAAAILELADNDHKRLGFSANAVSTFHTEFSLQHMVGAYESLYVDRNSSIAKTLSPS